MVSWWWLLLCVRSFSRVFLTYARILFSFFPPPPPITTSTTTTTTQYTFLQICTKRGPLGACLKTEVRTEQNDNDKANKYFSYTTKNLRERNELLLGTESSSGSNALIDRLRQQTDDNRERNQLEVDRKTFENDQVRELRQKLAVFIFIFIETGISLPPVSQSSSC